MSYDRRFSVLLDGKPFIDPTAGRQLRIAFSVSTGFSGYRGTGDVAIYNLKKSSMDEVAVGKTLTLQCGYASDGDNLGAIYTGKINNVLREREGPDLLVRALMAANTRDVNLLNSVYPTNTKLATIITDCAREAGYALEMNPDSFSDAPVYTAGYSIANEDPINVITRLATEHNFHAVIENERIIINKKMNDRGESVLTIGESTGMEMMPEVHAGGIDLSTRLNSRLAVGRLFVVDAQFATYTMANFYHDMSDIAGEAAGRGVHYIQKIDHTGDSWGDEWSSRITGLRYNG